MAEGPPLIRVRASSDPYSSVALRAPPTRWPTPDYLIGGRMVVELPPELERFVIRQVADGAFASVNDTICAALHLLQQRELGRVAHTAALSDEIHIGLASSTVARHATGRRASRGFAGGGPPADLENHRRILDGCSFASFRCSIGRCVSTSAPPERRRATTSLACDRWRPHGRRRRPPPDAPRCARSLAPPLADDHPPPEYRTLRQEMMRVQVSWCCANWGALQLARCANQTRVAMPPIPERGHSRSRSLADRFRAVSFVLLAKR